MQDAVTASNVLVPALRGGGTPDTVTYTVRIRNADGTNDRPLVHDRRRLLVGATEPAGARDPLVISQRT